MKCHPCSLDIMNFGDYTLDDARHRHCPHTLFSQDNDCRTFLLEGIVCLIKSVDGSNKSIDSPPPCSAFSSVSTLVELTNQSRPPLQQHNRGKFQMMMMCEYEG